MNVTGLSTWYSETAKPWLDMMISENRFLPYYVIILVILVGILVIIRHRNAKKSEKGKGGYRNFQGDIWYPDGRIWHKKSKTWEYPDYQNQEKQQP